MLLRGFTHVSVVAAKLSQVILVLLLVVGFFDFLLAALKYFLFVLELLIGLYTRDKTEG